MGMGKLTYEECRRKRIEENRKRLEDLNLPHLSQSLRNNLSPKSSPMKNFKPRTPEKRLVAVRRSARVASNPAPVYVEEKVRSFGSPRRSYGISNRNRGSGVYASDKARAYAVEKAEELVSQLDGNFPVLIRPMLPSHVSGCFWLGLPNYFCKSDMPKGDQTVTLVDEEGNEYPVVYLARKTGLSGGWLRFAVDHELADGDAVVFQVIKHGVLKVYIIRSNGAEEAGKEE